MRTIIHRICETAIAIVPVKPASSIAAGIAFGIFCMACSAKVFAATNMVFDGVIEPYGKRCSGTIKVKTKTVEWHTQFGHCKPSSYEVIEQNSSGKNQRTAYQLKGAKKACTHGVIALEFNETKPDYRNASWYKSAEDFRNGNEDLLCPVVRLDR